MNLNKTVLFDRDGKLVKILNYQETSPKIIIPSLTNLGDTISAFSDPFGFSEIFIRTDEYELTFIERSISFYRLKE